MKKLYGFLCLHCGIHSGEAIRTDDPESHAPTCCNGKPMSPYEIPNRNATVIGTGYIPYIDKDERSPETIAEMITDKGD